VDLSLRSLAKADVPAIEALLLANRPVFSDEECRTAVEMIHETFAQPDAQDPYQWVVADEAGKAVGFACFGTIPLTKGTFDLYFIAVHPETHARGVGKTLLRWVENAVAGQGGHLICVETSSRQDYAKTRRFYEQTMSYETACRIKDFYKKGDDKIIYIKYLEARRDS
jgi:ribosomal protein S18 acetylase RimI-like enzyme